MSNPNIWKYAHLGGAGYLKKVPKARRIEIARKAGIVSATIKKMKAQGKHKTVDKVVT